ncbi:MerC domain-containing protein [Cyclobacterium roseum]|uniref:MerC domain-containing protein n=1 Tax=Cyclobacterium roseum TaxID=2666137 RepID=UPI001390E892|nr:MerC domain-containing protein [Cyclobacterium roseum]
MDFVGFSASMLCAIHCIAVPFLVTLAPLAGLHFLHDPWIEYTIILLGFFIAAISLVHGYRRHHQKGQALCLVVAGFLLIGSGHLFHSQWGELLLTGLGGITVAIAHLVNWKDFRQSGSDLSS